MCRIGIVNCAVDCVYRKPAAVAIKSVSPLSLLHPTHCYPPSTRVPPPTATILLNEWMGLRLLCKYMEYSPFTRDSRFAIRSRTLSQSLLLILCFTSTSSSQYNHSSNNIYYNIALWHMQEEIAAITLSRYMNTISPFYSLGTHLNCSRLYCSLVKGAYDGIIKRVPFTV